MLRTATSPHNDHRARGELQGFRSDFATGKGAFGSRLARFPLLTRASLRDVSFPSLGCTHRWFGMEVYVH